MRISFDKRGLLDLLRWLVFFDDIDSLVLQAVAALRDQDLKALGELMNICQGLLNALQDCVEPAAGRFSFYFVLTRG